MKFVVLKKSIFICSLCFFSFADNALFANEMISAKSEKSMTISPKNKKEVKQPIVSLEKQTEITAKTSLVCSKCAEMCKKCADACEKNGAKEQASFAAYCWKQCELCSLTCKDFNRASLKICALACKHCADACIHCSKKCFKCKKNCKDVCVECSKMCSDCAIQCKECRDVCKKRKCCKPCMSDKKHEVKKHCGKKKSSCNIE